MLPDWQRVWGGRGGGVLPNQSFMLIKITWIKIYYCLCVSNRKPEGYFPSSINTVPLAPGKPDEFMKEATSEGQQTWTQQWMDQAAPVRSILLPDIRRIAAWEFLYGILVYKTQTLRKQINFFIVNMAMSDLLYPIFLFPWKLTQLHVGSWLLSGSL